MTILRSGWSKGKTGDSSIVEAVGWGSITTKQKLAVKRAADGRAVDSSCKMLHLGCSQLLTFLKNGRLDTRLPCWRPELSFFLLNFQCPDL